MIKRSKINMLNNKGQTGVEYILMILVVTTLIVSFFSYIKKNHLGDPSACQQAANRTKLLCQAQNFLLDTGDGQKRFQYFQFKR